MPRQEVVDQIAASLEAHGFDQAHALIVRPQQDSWQILSGHHRAAAARKAGLTAVPCWVRDLDDEAAYMLLVTANAQSELTPIERGRHALHSSMDVKAYATSVGRERVKVQREVMAARVATVFNGEHDLSKQYMALVEIHAAPEWLWCALVEAMVAEEWTVEQTRRRIAALGLAKKGGLWVPTYLDAAAGLVSGAIKAPDIERVLRAEQSANEEISRILALPGFDDYEPKSFVTFDADIRNISDAWEHKGNVNGFYTVPGPFTKCSDAIDFISETLAPFRKALAEMEQALLDRQREQEEVQARAIRLREHCSLEEWKRLDEATRSALLPPTGADATSFTKQDSKAIEWAMWSWNPITGCEHECSYCYAREIAESSQRSAAFPFGFAPTLKPRAVLAPRAMKVPRDAMFDTRLRNVFLGSMADVFGRWVPREWIDAVLAECRAASEWNFLCLTKFPKRMAEFAVPDNVWMGATVDLQARVKATEEAFASVNSKVRWLSCEPLIEPLRFHHLDRFHWIVIGGASRTNRTPRWSPPFAWVVDLVTQAREAGLKVYFKSNLLDGNARILELPFNAPIEPDPTEAPAVFHYLRTVLKHEQDGQ